MAGQQLTLSKSEKKRIHLLGLKYTIFYQNIILLAFYPNTETRLPGAH